MNYFIALFKRVIFPIERKEMGLFFRLALLLFCILFNFSCLRSLKDSLVIPLIGAEAISFLKLWLVLPSAIIFTIVYVKLSNRFNLAQLFSMIVCFFISFFLLFAFVIYPNQDFYHISASNIDIFCAKYPHIKWFIKIAGKWSYVCVYILSELWGAMVINLMFWQFTNHLFKSNQAQRLYPIIGMFGSFGLILSGNLLVFFSQISNFSPNIISIFSTNSDAIEVTIKLIISVVSIASIIAIAIFYDIVRLNTANQVGISVNILETKTTLNVLESIKLILQSKYIFYILILVISYGLSINILEGPWKSKLSQLYKNPCDYIRFMGHFNIWMGVSSVIMTIIGGNILRNFGWLASAYITPIVIAITGSLFFIFVIFGHKIQIGVDPIYVAVIIGAAQNIMTKSSKYSLFDATKEMSYIPLSVELKSKGKAAIEVIGSKLGKSLGAFIQFIAFTIVPDLDFNSMSIFLMIVFIIITIIWLLDVNKLSKEYNRLHNNAHNI